MLTVILCFSEGKKYLPLHDFDLKESSKEPKKLPTLGKVIFQAIPISLFSGSAL